MGILYIVPLPIGNLKDITLRALEILKEVDFILAEKPRRTLQLLNYYEIKKPIYPYFAGKNERYLANTIREVKKGEKAAFVSEAGTPGIADPGQKVVAEAIRAGLKVVALPGASALTLVLSLAGLRFSETVFYGYLPKKGRSKIKEKIASDLKFKRALIFFFSPYRLLKDLEFLQNSGAKEIVLLKEATKKYEEVFRGTIPEVLSLLSPEKLRGEWAALVV